jgi:methionine aminotransferase
MKFPGYIKSKLPQAGTTIFTVMSALAQEHKAINLSQGYPDFLCNEELMHKADEYIRKGYNQYAPMPGLLSLRERIAEKIHSLYGATINPETEITITPGGTEAIYAAITSVVEENDEVILFEPAYDSYAPAIELCKGVPKFIKLEAMGSGKKNHIEQDQSHYDQYTAQPNRQCINQKRLTTAGSHRS